MASDIAVGVQCKLKNILGQTFGRLTVIAREGSNSAEQATWRCLCICGNETVVAGITLRKGFVVSCGCYNREATSKRATTHGLCKHPLYEPWKSMRERVKKENKAHKKHYADKNITICKEWAGDPKIFIEQMFPSWKPNQNLTIDRIDNTKGYYFENCRWATAITQNNNKSNNHHITYKGKTQTVAQWGRELNLCQFVIAGRRRIHWSVEKTFLTPGRPFDSGRSKKKKSQL